MTARIISRAGVEEISDREFFIRVFGHPPKTPEQRKAEADAYWAERKKQARAELEQLRDNLCKQASPELAAKFRARWAEEDARDAERERRAA